jgi:L,D-transpeptidase catalytic domain
MPRRNAPCHEFDRFASVRAPARLLTLAAATLLALAGGAAVHGDEPAPPLAGPGAVVAAPATRGTAVQETPTTPPTAPASTTPAATDRNVIHIDSLDVPPDSGSGRRVVYSKSIQRVWLIEQDGSLYNTHRVSGRMDQPLPGTFSVWSRSEWTCSIVHRDICMRWMVRFAHTFSGNNIGFHQIPEQNGQPIETLDQLGAPLSGGCVRQSPDDAILMWNWAQIGTTVVVLP